MCPTNDDDLFHGAYNELITDLKEDAGNTANPFAKFSALASPTLSKQESLTHLFTRIMTPGLERTYRSERRRAVISFIPKLVLRLIFLFILSCIFVRKQIPSGAIVFRSWLVPASMSGRRYSDVYFGKAIDAVREQNEVVVLLWSLDLRLLWQFIRIEKPSFFFHVASLLSPLDVLRVGWRYLRSGPARHDGGYTLDGHEVTTDLVQSLFLDYYDFRAFTAYVESIACETLGRLKPKQYIYVLENQSWEKVVCSKLGAAGVPLVGYQSSGFSDIFLNFFPTKRDSTLDPMPDRILTVGEGFTTRLRELGHFKCKLETFCGLRFDYPARGGEYTVLAPNKRIFGRILYAFAVHKYQYRPIFDQLCHVFGETDIQVDLKVHPLHVRDAAALFGQLPSNFSIVAHLDHSSLSRTYDVVLFNDNSYGIEVLLGGVKAIQYKHGIDAVLPVDERLIYFDLWETWIDKSGLVDIREELQAKSFDKSFDVPAVMQYVNFLYSTPDSVDLAGKLTKSEVK